MIPPRPLGSVVAGGHSTCHGRQQLTTEFLTDHTRIAQGAFHNRGQQCTNLGTMQQPPPGGGEEAQKQPHCLGVSCEWRWRRCDS